MIDVAVSAAGKEDPDAATGGGSGTMGWPLLKASLGKRSAPGAGAPGGVRAVLTSAAAGGRSTGRAGTGKGIDAPRGRGDVPGGGAAASSVLLMDGTTARRIADELRAALPRR